MSSFQVAQHVKLKMDSRRVDFNKQVAEVAKEALKDELMKVSAPTAKSLTVLFISREVLRNV